MSRRLLPLIVGGATVAVLASVRDPWGYSALSFAACDCLDDVKGGATAEDLAKDISPGEFSALYYAIRFGQITV